MEIRTPWHHLEQAVVGQGGPASFMVVLLPLTCHFSAVRNPSTDQTMQLWKNAAWPYAVGFMWFGVFFRTANIYLMIGPIKMAILIHLPGK